MISDRSVEKVFLVHRDESISGRKSPNGTPGTELWCEQTDIQTEFLATQRLFSTLSIEVLVAIRTALQKETSHGCFLTLRKLSPGTV